MSSTSFARLKFLPTLEFPIALLPLHGVGNFLCSFQSSLFCWSGKGLLSVAMRRSIPTHGIVFPATITEGYSTKLT